MLASVEKLPSVLKRALFEVGYKSNTVNLSAHVSVGLSNPANDYARSFSGTVDLVSGKYEIEWSGFDDAERNDPFPSNPTVDLGHSLAVVKGSNENSEVYAYIYLHPDLAEKFRIVPVALTSSECEILYAYGSLISKARKPRLMSIQKQYPDKPFDQVIDDLVCRGFLKRYPKGSIRITTRGRIALDSAKP